MRRNAQVNNHKLTPTEEQALLDRIISFDEYDSYSLSILDAFQYLRMHMISSSKRKLNSGFTISINLLRDALVAPFVIVHPHVCTLAKNYCLPTTTSPHRSNTHYPTTLPGHPPHHCYRSCHSPRFDLATHTHSWPCRVK